MMGLIMSQSARHSVGCCLLTHACHALPGGKEARRQAAGCAQPAVRQGSLQAEHGAPLHAELAALRASLQALAALLATLPDAPSDAFKQACLSCRYPNSAAMKIMC